MPQVYLHFEGTVAVEVDGDPKADTWSDTIEDAWEELTAVEICEATELVGHDLVEEANRQQPTVN